VAPDLGSNFGGNSPDIGQEMTGNQAFDAGVLAPSPEIERRSVDAAKPRIFLEIAGRSAGLMDKVVDRSGVFEERPVDRSVSRKNDFLSLLVQIKMVGQRRGVVGNPKTAERQGVVEPQDLSRPESLKANPCPDVFFPQPEKVQEAAGEADRLLGTQEPDLTIIEDQAMDERRQAIDMVRMDMGENDGRDFAGVEIEPPDFGHDAPGAVDEDELSARSKQDRGIVPLRRGYPAACT
jgi:hypothetical protein